MDTGLAHRCSNHWPYLQDRAGLSLPRLALTTAEFLAYQCEKHVLVILTDMSSCGGSYGR